MSDWDWDAALDAFGRGRSLVAVETIRAVAAAGGMRSLPLHPLEVERVTELRTMAQAYADQADAIEARALPDGTA